MSILVISKSAWKSNNAFGNTLNNFFSELREYNFFSLYCREELPDCQDVKEYFHITEIQILNNIREGKEIGKYVEAKIKKENKDKLKVIDLKTEKEQKLIEFVKRHCHFFAIVSNEILWQVYKKKIQEGKINNFLEKNNIDFIFAPVTAPIYLIDLISFVIKKTNATPIFFIADDVYSYYSINPFKHIYQYLVRKKIRLLVKDAHVFGASKILCEKYSNFLNCDIHPLYKSCLSLEAPYQKEGNNIEIVYAGNLFYGRAKALLEFSKAIDIFNRKKDMSFLHLSIYTNSSISKKMNAEFNMYNSVNIYPTQPYEVIQKKFKNADINLIIESSDRSNIRKTRFSFSTKIMDCLQSGSAVLAVGLLEIGTINFLSTVPGVETIDKTSNLENFFEKLYSKDYKKVLYENAKKISCYAEMNCSRTKNNAMFRTLFSKK